MTMKADEDMLAELKDICDKAVEGLCPEGHFGMGKCPYPGGDDDSSMCGQCYMELIHAKTASILKDKLLKAIGEIENPYCDDPNSPHYQDLDIYCNSVFARAIQAVKDKISESNL